MRQLPQVALIFVVIFAWILATSAASSYDTYLLRIVASWAIAAIGVQLLLRTTGDLCFGHGAFIGVGAYAYALLGGATGPWSYLLCLGVSAAAAMLVSVAVYGLLWRVSGVYFTLATVCFAETFRIAVSSAYDVLGGDNGIHGLPRPPWVANGMPGVIVIGSLLLATLIMSISIDGTSLGRAGHAVRQSPHRVESLGMRATSIRFVLRVVSAIPAGIAGMLLASLEGGCHPQLFGWLSSGELITLALLCGPRVVASPVCAAALLVSSRSWLAGIWDHWPLMIGATLVIISRMLSWPISGTNSSTVEEHNASN